VLIAAGLLVLVLAMAIAVRALGPRRVAGFIIRHVRGERTVEQRLEQYGAQARGRLQPYFRQAAVPYPPAKLTLVGLKQERQLEVYAAGTDGRWRHVRSYPILGCSGHAGPKLAYGDGQVPEGLYRIESLNPNSLYHLALRLNYPNDDDRARAQADGRTELGGDIMIHGNRGSAGCLAMGDTAIEELFVLAADTGIARTDVILAPADFRRREPNLQGFAPPAWTSDLYQQIRQRLHELPAAP
jgi:hypothetical protein